MYVHVYMHTLCTYIHTYESSFPLGFRFIMVTLLSPASLAAVHYFTFEHPYSLIGRQQTLPLLCVEEHLQVRGLSGGVGGGSVYVRTCVCT